MAEKFLKVPEPVGQLYYDCILLDGDEPVLFTCTNDNKELYYCVCIYNVLGAQEWLITRTTPVWMCRLLKNRITMRRAVTLTGKIWFAKEHKNGRIRWEYKDVDKFPDDYLPTDGVYMDADEGEFDEEIAHYTAMIPKPKNEYWYSIKATYGFRSSKSHLIKAKQRSQFAGEMKKGVLRTDLACKYPALSKKVYIINEDTLLVDKKDSTKRQRLLSKK